MQFFHNIKSKHFTYLQGITYEKIISQREIDDSDKKTDYNDNLRHKESTLEI